VAAAPPSPRDRVAWITGASSGIGLELARKLAADGLKVAISARSADTLAASAALHANLSAYPVDVTDTAAVAATIDAIGRDLGPIDLAVLNAGVWHPMTAASYDREKATQSVAINYVGVLNGLAPLMARMAARGSGHIALVASVAGYRGLPKSVAYGPTKAALINAAECLYPELKRKGVKLQVICPGFVETPMTAVNDFPMPFKITAEDAAERIRQGLERDAFEIVFPTRMAITMKTLRVLPYRLFFWLTGRML
jgi:short-subunit dehydrogenase